MDVTSSIIAVVALIGVTISFILGYMYGRCAERYERQLQE